MDTFSVQPSQDPKQDRAFGLLNQVRAAVMEEAESRIDERLKQLWTQAAAEVKKQEREHEKSMNQLLEEAKSLVARQQSMQAENQSLMSMMSSLCFGRLSSDLLTEIKQVLPGEGDAKEPGGDTPSTATTGQHSSGSSGSSGSPRRLEVEMPELPPFPGAALPAPPGLDPPALTAPALPALSLAEALGIGNDGNDQVNVSKESECDASDVDATDAFVFKLTLRVADDMDLGLCFSKKGEVLRIDRVQSGAAESWNRQCSTSGSPERVLVPGDLVVSVNDQSDPEIMLQESRTRKLLKLRVLRRSGESKLKPNGVNARNGVNPMTSWEAVPHVQNVPHVQYPLTFPTGLGYGIPGDWMTFPWAP